MYSGLFFVANTLKVIYSSPRPFWYPTKEYFNNEHHQDRASLVGSKIKVAKEPIPVFKIEMTGFGNPAFEIFSSVMAWMFLFKRPSACVSITFYYVVMILASVWVIGVAFL